MSIPALPSLDRTSATFKADLDTFFLSQLPATTSAFNTEIDRINAIGYGSYNANSTTSLTIGTGSKSLTVETGRGFAVGQALLIASTASPTNYMGGQVTSYDSGTGALVFNATASNGSGTLAAWTISVTSLAIGGAPTVLQRTITGADTLIASDQGKLINASGTFTLSVTAAATLGNGWYCYLRNTGTGTVTLDPNGAETVDGVTSGPVRDTILLVCNGTGFTASKVGPFSHMEVRTSGTSWTCPLGVRRARVRVQGGGGGGGRSGDSYHPGYPGAGGGYCEGLYPISPGTAYTYAIGAAGNNAFSNGSPGSAGGNTTMTINGATLTANGGAGGAGATTSGASSGGTATNGQINIDGQPGIVNFYVAGITNAYNGTRGGSSVLGMGGVSHGNSCYAGSGYGSGGAAGMSAAHPGTTGVIILEY